MIQNGATARRHAGLESSALLPQAARAHGRAVATIGARLAAVLELAEEEIADIGLAAALHDIGKATVPRAVLDKPGPLTGREWRLIRRHPGEGERLLRASFADRPSVLAAVRSHHERWDGAGYPDGLAGAEAPLAARIVAVADAYQAMLETRPYRASLTPAAALAEIEANARSQFDPDCAAALRVVVRA
jgi:HD-GYP domain-containing protein (c-di-GMP phosphodiesterase class II)